MFEKKHNLDLSQEDEKCENHAYKRLEFCDEEAPSCRDFTQELQVNVSVMDTNNPD